jgi:DNA-binding transcriptional MerR regulator
MDHDLLAIGQFARLCRLSVKQLRHYDELGLLRPAQVDPNTGYRYYRADQARAAVSIALLRSLDVPLAAIGQVLAGAAAAEVLAAVRDRQEADLLRRRRTLAVLDRVLTQGMPRVEVTLVREPARRVAVVGDATPSEDIPTTTGRCVVRLLEALASADQASDAPLIGLFPLDVTQQVIVAVAAEVDGEVPGTTPEVLAGGVFACATHVGSYEQLSLTAHGLLAWCGERGHLPIDRLREVYVSDPRETPPEQLVTRLMIRLEDTE